jgi:endonuclease/exonuclease/phosphatase family metal-dependent hydrolase
VRVVTWNVWWRFGPWARRRQAILTVLRTLQPDVVGLQEVWGRGEENLAGWLADMLGMHWTWAASPAPRRWQDRLDVPTVEIGNAVLSRWPLLDRAVTRLPCTAGDDDGRLAPARPARRPSAPLPFFTTHLSAPPHAAATRLAQIVTLAEFVAAYRAGTPFPPVVTGDLNAWADSDEVRLLGGYKTAPAVAGQVLFDAWEYADPKGPLGHPGPGEPVRPTLRRRGPGRLRLRRAARARRPGPRALDRAGRRRPPRRGLALRRRHGHRRTGGRPVTDLTPPRLAWAAGLFCGVHVPTG